MAAYERTFALWPRLCEEFDIETATATTRVHTYRPHPAGIRSAAHRCRGQRSGLVPARGGARQGRPGLRDRSAGDANPRVPRALMTPPAACAAWLDELLTQLSDRPAHLVGFSYGG
jgi:hypothetical protein